LVENGETFAMQRLGERLPDGNERTSWLRAAAARGNLQAMEKLANQIIGHHFLNALRVQLRQIDQYFRTRPSPAI